MRLKSLLAGLLFAGASLANAQTTTVIVVRHAEKTAEPAADPLLTPAGSARAEALVEALKDVGINAVVTTEFQRTRLTGAPVAAKLGLTGEVISARIRGHAKAVADSVLAKYKGKAVLVVGHSNTVPEIVEALGAPKPGAICDDGYDNMFVVTIPASGAATVLRLHYGTRAACP